MPGHKDELNILLISEQSPDQNEIKFLPRLKTHDKFRIVGQAKSAKEALEVIGNYPLDFIVTENGAARSTNLNTIKQLKRSYPDIPIILTSSHIEEIFIAESLQAGASAYIIKQNIGQ